MRRPTTHRIGALGLSLLLQLFVLSGLLHPCCLGAEGGAGSHHGTSPQMPAHAEASGVDGGAAHHHVAAQAPASDGGATHHSVETEAPADHSSHGGCEGECGLCCSTATSVGLPAAPLVSMVGTEPAPAHVVSEPGVTPRSQPRFILPFANGPPTAGFRSV